MTHNYWAIKYTSVLYEMINVFRTGDNEFVDMTTAPPNVPLSQQLLPSNEEAAANSQDEMQTGRFFSEFQFCDFSPQYKHLHIDKPSDESFGIAKPDKIDPRIWEITQDVELARVLQEEEDRRRLELRRQEDLDDASLALAIRLQQEEELALERFRMRKFKPTYSVCDQSIPFL